MAVTLNANTSTGFIATSDTSGVLQLQTGGTAAVTVDASQQVGIGTASPGYKLDVSGVVSSNDTVRVTSGTTVTIMSTAGGGEGTVGTSSNHALQFRTNNTERMRIDTSGNVGIGTASPLAKFEVRAGRSYFQANSEAYSIYMSYASGTAGFFIGSPSADAMSFSSSGGAERMRIDSSGNLLVGTTSTQAGYKMRLSASGSFNSGIFYQSDSNNTNALDFRNPTGTQVGSVYVTASSTTYATSSDYRLKHDIQPMQGALAKVVALKPVTYKWNVDGSAGEGFIAHELQEVVPDAVIGEKDAVDADGNPVYQGIDTSFLVATLTAAIKEQQAIITSLTDRITLLESK